MPRCVLLYALETQHCAAMTDRIYRPCSSLTAHTMRSTQAALAWQRSLRGLGSPGNRSSWRALWISDWLLLNCSRTKSWTSVMKLVCTSDQRFTWNDHIRQRAFKDIQILKRSSFHWNNNLWCNGACLAASWTCWRTAGRWRLCRRARCLDSPSFMEEQNKQTHGLEHEFNINAAGQVWILLNERFVFTSVTSDTTASRVLRNESETKCFTCGNNSEILVNIWRFLGPVTLG